MASSSDPGSALPALLVDLAWEAALVVDQAGVVRAANSSAGLLLEAAPSDLEGTLVEDLIPRFFDFAGDLEARSEPGAPRTGVQALSRRGTKIRAECMVVPVAAAGAGWKVVVLRQLEPEPLALDPQSRLAAIVMSAPNAITTWSPEGIITGWNHAAAELFGYAESEAVGLPGEVLLAGHRRPLAAEVRRRVLSGETLPPFESEWLRRDGTAVAVRVTVSPVRDHSGGVVEVAAIAEDLTAIRRSEERFKRLLEALPDAVVCIDERGTMTLVNSAAEELFGYQAPELVGSSIDLLVPDEVRPRHHLLRARYFAEPRPRPIGVGLELAARRHDGSLFRCEISLAPIPTDDGLWVVALIRDISERLRLEAERQRLREVAERERLQASHGEALRLASLGELAGGVAHDFNNLLAVVLNYSFFVKEELGMLAELSAEQAAPLRHDLEQIEMAAERGARLTQQLLAYARRDVAAPRVADLNLVIANVEELLRHSLGEHINLELALAPQLRRVAAAPDRLEQVLVNLAVNARDAMPEGGRLIIETSNFDLEPTLVDQRPDHPPPGLYVRVRVSDTGVGMSPEVARRAFEPFFTTKPKGEGTGLGLATAYGVIRQYGGAAHIYSQEGFGSCVAFILPATERAVEEIPGPAPEEGPCRGETVLLVEDEDGVREVARRVLAAAGYQVLTAGSGEEALELVRSHPGPIHCLITDVLMPRMRGHQLAQQVLGMRPAIRVLLMSGYASGTVRPGPTVGQNFELLDKPFTAAQLRSRVRAILDQRS